MTLEEMQNLYESEPSVASAIQQRFVVWNNEAQNYVPLRSSPLGTTECIRFGWLIFQHAMITTKDILDRAKIKTDQLWTATGESEQADLLCELKEILENKAS